LQNLEQWFNIFDSRCWYFYVVYNGSPTGRFIFTENSIYKSLMSEMKTQKAEWKTIKIIKAIKITGNIDIKNYIRNIISGTLTDEEISGKSFNLVKVFRDKQFLKFLTTDFSAFDKSLVSYTSGRYSEDIWSIFEYGISYRWNYRDDRVVFLNKMNVSDFKYIDGIGEKLSKELASNQPYNTLEDVKIKGIGETKYKKILDYIKFHFHEEK